MSVAGPPTARRTNQLGQQHEKIDPDSSLDSGGEQTNGRNALERSVTSHAGMEASTTFPEQISVVLPGSSGRMLEMARHTHEDPARLASHGGYDDRRTPSPALPRSQCPVKILPHSTVWESLEISLRSCTARTAETLLPSWCQPGGTMATAAALPIHTSSTPHSRQSFREPHPTHQTRPNAPGAFPPGCPIPVACVGVSDGLLWGPPEV